MTRFPFNKIISGGQAGADRAGLDAALKHGIPAGGYCPKGRRAEDGPIADHYPLVETPSQHYAVRTCMNVRAASGILILNLGGLDGGTKLTAEYAAKRNKPCLIVQLDTKSHTSAQVADWITGNGITILNIAGPRESKRPGIYRLSLKFVDRLIMTMQSRIQKAALQQVTGFVKTIFPADCHQQVFLVGGIVRDMFSGKMSTDIDLAAALPEEYLARLGFRVVKGKSTAPIMFRHDKKFGKIEITLIPDGTSIADDLAQRDFSANAMAMTLDGRLIDPLDGRKDLRRKRLRVCSPESFEGDPIRIFRAFRFEADGWQMTRATENLIHSYSWDNRLEAIPVERFSRELQKAMTGTCPVRFFTRMLELHVGAGYLPELFRIPAIPAGPVQHHPEGDLFSHCCQVLERMSLLSADPLARFCAFFHDLGKLATKSDHYPKHHGHNEAGVEIARQFCDRLKLPATWKRALAWTNGLHGHANRWEELRDATKIRMAEQAVKAGIGEILQMVSAADKPRSHVMPGWETAIRVAGMTAEELGIAPLQLEMMKPENRGAFILQKQVEVYRKML